jgi:hypothetical protein
MRREPPRDAVRRWSRSASCRATPRADFPLRSPLCAPSAVGLASATLAADEQTGHSQRCAIHRCQPVRPCCVVAGRPKTRRCACLAPMGAYSRWGSAPRLPRLQRHSGSAGGSGNARGLFVLERAERRSGYRLGHGLAQIGGAAIVAFAAAATVGGASGSMGAGLSTGRTAGGATNVRGGAFAGSHDRAAGRAVHVPRRLDLRGRCQWAHCAVGAGASGGGTNSFGLGGGSGRTA